MADQAWAHSTWMANGGGLAHTPRPLLRGQGENVAVRPACDVRDGTFVNALFFASPAHRENMLRPDYRRFGAGFVTDANGALWITERFGD